MAAWAPVTTPTADPPRTAGAGQRPAGVARAAVAAPFTRRQGRELLFCLAGLPLPLVSPLALFVLAVDLTWLVAGGARGNPSPADMAIAGVCLGLLLVLLVATGAARGLGSLHRPLAARLLGDAGRGAAARRRATARGRARPGLARRARLAGRGLPAAQAAGRPCSSCYAVFFWVGGLVNLSYPFWWGAFRNHPPGVRLSPVPVFTPFGCSAGHVPRRRPSPARSPPPRRARRCCSPPRG